MLRYVLIQDPWHDYATRFIEHFQRKYGYRTICFYSNRSEFVRQAPSYPALRSDCVAATFEVAPDRLQQFADHLRSRYDIAAIVPFNEPAVTPAVALAESLQLSWSQPQVLPRFRDKYLLKEHVRNRDPSLRLNATRQVSAISDVDLARTEPEFARFVLKPNDGFGNRSIGVFDTGSDRAQIEAYFQATPGPVLMEEYIDGTEYFVNGQVDAAGESTVIGIFEYQRDVANGRSNIDYSTRRLPYADPLFATLATYCRQVISATGLTRSPFHLELKVDAHGPCLIEVAARLPGLGNAFLSSELHGNDFDWFDAAAHYYLTGASYGPLKLNWQAYDSAAVRYVHGIADRAERVHQLQGTSATEALPEFHSWVKKPKLGDAIRPTMDCLSMPWSVILKADTEDQVTTAERQIRHLIAWNKRPAAIERRLTIATNVVRRGIAAVKHRVLFALLPFSGTIRIVNDYHASPVSRNALQRIASRCANALVRRYQLFGLGKHRREFPPKVTPEYEATAKEAVTWAEEYLAKPHPELGRKGPICPFVKHTVDIGRYFVSVRAQIDGSSLHALRGAVLDEAAAFLQHSPNVGSKGAFGSLVMVFPNIPDARLGILDEIHSELKTALMERDLMFSPFHKYSNKPSISNPDFKVFRAPFAALVVRHMDVRDIAFLNSNRKAFMHFHARYAHLFSQGKVSNEFGYVRMYDEARARFGVE